MLKTALHRLAKGSLIYGIGGMLQRFMGLLLLPFYTRELSPHDYGVIALVSLVGVAMSGVLTLGTGNSMGLLYYLEQDKTKRPTIIWTNVLLMVVNGMLWYALLLNVAPVLSVWIFQTAQYAELLRLALIGCILGFIADPWLAFLRMEERAKEYVSITLISSFISIGLSIYLVLFIKIGVSGVILAGAIAQGIMLVVIWVVVGRKLPFGLDWQLFKPLIRIGFPSIFGLFAFLLIDYADRQMIERLLGLHDLGVYSIGYSFGMIMTIAVGAFGTAWPPFFMSYARKKDEAREIFSKVLTLYVIGFGSFTLLFFAVAKIIVLSMTDVAFRESYNVIGLVAAGYAFKGCYLIILPGIYFAKKLYWQSFIEWIAAIFNIIANFLFIPILGVFGAALATFFSYFLLFVVGWLISQKFMNVRYDKIIIKILIIATSGCALLHQINNNFNDNLLFLCLTNILVLFIYLSIFFYFYMINKKQLSIKIF